MAKYLQNDAQKWQMALKSTHKRGEMTFKAICKSGKNKLKSFAKVAEICTIVSRRTVNDCTQS